MASGTSITARLQVLAGHRRAPIFLALLALLLALPALGGGFMLDDYFHLNVLRRQGEWAAADPLRDLFAFIPADHAAWMRDSGMPPWWSSPTVYIHFARPLTALTHMLDHALWPNSPALQHLQSLLWFALAVGLAASFYRRIFSSPAVACMAALLFAVSDTHAGAAGWLSGRNGLVCLVFGLGTMHLHLSWRRTRRTRSWRHLLLAMILFAAGLACGEAALGATAYIGAWQFTREEGPWSRRLLPLAPYAGIVALWRILYVTHGFGTQGSSLYLDPGSHPVLFLQALVERAPLLLAAQWAKAPVDAWILLSRQTQVTASILAALIAAGLLGLLWKLVRRDARARFWALGMTLSLIPICAAFPTDRLLLFAGLGAFGLMAECFESTGLWPRDEAMASGWRRGIAWLLLMLHGPLAAFLFALRILSLPALTSFSHAGARQAPRGPEVAQQSFVFINGNDFLVVYVRLLRTAIGDAPPPRRVTQLASFSSLNLVSREDARTLVIRTEGGFLAQTMDRLLADPVRRFTPGERIERPDYVAEIRTVTADGRPLEVAFHFHQPLEDPALRWLYWKDGRLVEFPLPAIGERVAVKPI